MTPLVAPGRPRGLLALALLASVAALVGAVGLTQHALFQQPSLLKYAITVGGPALVALAVTAHRPLCVLTPVIVVAAPFASFQASFGAYQVPVLVPLLGLAAVAACFDGPARLHRSPLALPALVAVPLLLLPIAQGSTSVEFTKSLLSLLLVAWVVARTAREPGGTPVVLAAIVGSAVLQSVIAIWEARTGAKLNLYSGAGNVVFGDRYFYNFQDANRPVGSYFDPISLGNALAIAGPLMVALAMQLRGRARWLVVAGTLVLSVALALSLSRMAWIGFAVGVVVAIVLLPRRERRIAAVATLVGSLLVVGAAMTLGGDSLRQRFDTIKDPTNLQHSTGEGDRRRMELWDAALQVFGEHPVAGVGVGNLEGELQRRVAKVGTYTHAHSTYFQLLGEAGALGLALLATFLAGLIATLRLALRRDRLLGAGLGGAVAALLVCWSTDWVVVYPNVAATVGVLLGLVAAAGRRTAPRAAVASVPGRPTLVPPAPPAATVARPAAAATAPTAVATPIDESPSVATRIAGSVALLTVRRLAVAAVTAVGGLVVARLLGPGEYGVLAAAQGIAGLALAAVDLGFAAYLSRELARRPDEGPALVRATVQLQFAWAVLVALAVAGIGVAVGVGETRGLALVVLAPGVAFAGLNGFRQVFYVRYDVRSLVVIDLPVAVAQLAAMVSLAALGAGVVGVAASVTGATIVGALAVAARSRRHVSVRSARRAAAGVRREVLRVSAPLGLTSFMASVYLLIDLVLLGWLAPEREVGLYAAAVKLLGLLLMVPALVASAALPGLATESADRGRVSALVARLWHWLAAASLPVCIGLALFAPAVMQLAFGSGFTDAAPFLRVLALAAVLAIGNTVLGILLISHHLIRAQLVQNAVAITVNVVGNVVLVGTYGVIASAWMTVAAEGIVFVGAVWALRRHVDFDPSVQAVLRPTAAVAAASVVAVAVLSWSTPAAIAAYGLALVVAVLVLDAWPAELRRRLRAA